MFLVLWFTVLFQDQFIFLAPETQGCKEVCFKLTDICSSVKSWNAEEQAECNAEQTSLTDARSDILNSLPERFPEIESIKDKKFYTENKQVNKQVNKDMEYFDMLYALASLTSDQNYVHYLELGYLEQIPISPSFSYYGAWYVNSESDLIPVYLEVPLCRTNFHFPCKFEIAGLDCNFIVSVCEQKSVCPPVTQKLTVVWQI